MSTVVRNLGLSIDQSALIRYDTYDGEQYLVVPCVALVGNEVVEGLNSKGPEFVPAVELALSAPQWNNRPVLPNHPQDGQSSANIPEILSTYRFGWTFNSEFSDNKLRMEAWLSESRAKKVGPDAEWVINELKAGRPVELSVGAYIELEESKGISPGGKPYQYIWRNIGSDHLAIGLGGHRGACNLEMGCGALRVNAKAGDQIMGQGQKQEQESKSESESGMPNRDSKQDRDSKDGLWARFLRLATPFRTLMDDQGPSDVDLRWAVYDALYAVEPAFGDVIRIHFESKTVIYCTFPYSEQERFWRRSFTITEDGTVTINDDKEEVIFETKAKTVAAAESRCGCHVQNQEQGRNSESDIKKEEGKMATREELINKLQNMPQDQLEKLVSGTEATPAPVPATPNTNPTPTPAPTPTPQQVPTPDPNSTPATTGQETVSLPKSELDTLLAMAAREIEREKQEREQLVAFCASKQNVIPAASLQQKSLNDLRELASVLSPSDPPDFSARGIPILSGNTAGQKDEYTPPDPLGINKYLYPS